MSWQKRHEEAAINPAPGVETALMTLLGAIDDYCSAVPGVGADTVLGEGGIKPMLTAYLTLLNGDTGRLDRGVLTAAARYLADVYGINLDD